MGDSDLGPATVEAAHRIAGSLGGAAVHVDASTTVLLLNSLVSAWHSRRRIYLNAFQRSAEVLDHFGHRLHRLRFDVHSLDPQSIIPEPHAQDVVITLSGSLRTAPVLVSLLHADQVGLYRFVITAQSAQEARRKLQGVLPVHIPGVTAQGRSPSRELRSVLPLGSLFELRSFLYLEALVEVLSEAMDEGRSAGAAVAAEPGQPDPVLMATLLGARAAASRCGDRHDELVDCFEDCLDRIESDALGSLLGLLLDTARKGNTVYLAGYGRSNPVGGMFAHRLGNLGIGAAMTPSRLERPSRKGDMVLALSGSGNTYEVLQRLSGARHAGLRTAVVTATPGSSVTHFADVTVVVPATTETRGALQFAERQMKPSGDPRPTRSTFSLHSALLLEAVIAVLMRELGKYEEELVHTDPWQGFDPGESDE